MNSGYAALCFVDFFMVRPINNNIRIIYCHPNDDWLNALEFSNQSPVQLGTQSATRLGLIDTYRFNIHSIHLSSRRTGNTTNHPARHILCSDHYVRFIAKRTWVKIAVLCNGLEPC